jgi:hypothetical protein
MACWIHYLADHSRMGQTGPLTSPQRCTNQSLQMVSDDILALIGSRFPKLRDLELGRVLVTGDWSFCFRGFKKTKS